MSERGTSAAARILLYGVTGSGKTTLARRIGELTGVPSFSMDDEVGWLPGWRERPDEEQRRRVAELVEADGWVFDTAYSRWRDLVVPHVDLIVALDYPRRVSLRRLVRRSWRRVRTQEPVCNGNVESWRQLLSRDSILVWHFRTFAEKRAQIDAWEADPAAPQLVRLRSPAETEEWLTALSR